MAPAQSGLFLGSRARHPKHLGWTRVNETRDQSCRLLHGLLTEKGGTPALPSGSTFTEHPLQAEEPRAQEAQCTEEAEPGGLLGVVSRPHRALGEKTEILAAGASVHKQVSEVWVYHEVEPFSDTLFGSQRRFCKPDQSACFPNTIRSPDAPFKVL